MGILHNVSMGRVALYSCNCSANRNGNVHVDSTASLFCELLFDGGSLFDSMTNGGP